MQESVWNGFRRVDFTFMDRAAILVFPNEENKTDKWLLKTEYFDAFPDLEIEMVKRGWHLAYVANLTRWCLDEDLDVKKAFAEYLQETYGLSRRCVPVGMSCGGMIAVKLAARHPDMIFCLYLDAPVMNLLSCPCGLGRAGAGMYEEFVTATGMTLEDLITYRDHPMDKVPVLLQNHIPVMMVYGDADDVVPYEENGIVLEKMYKAQDGVLKCIGKKGCGHHPHGLEDVTPIVQFLEQYSS